MPAVVWVFCIGFTYSTVHTIKTPKLVLNKKKIL